MGCGQSPVAGWANFDNSPSLLLARLPRVTRALRVLGLLSQDQVRFAEFCRGHDIRRANAQRIPVGDGAADVLYSSHMLEHLSRGDARVFLAEARRVLRPGGTLRLCVPDLRILAEEYLADGDADRFVAGSLLAVDTSTWVKRIRMAVYGNREHQWMYDGRSLCKLIESCGFTHVAVVAPGESRIQSPQPLNLRELAEVSVYVEAERPAN